ncbi:hypothetical protein NXX40_25825 (plasmid) [Parabacteroides distasonis]|nr:hypothetical protein [Parabacteroides distasonis]
MDSLIIPIDRVVDSSKGKTRMLKQTRSVYPFQTYGSIPAYKSFSVDIEIQQKGSIRFLEDNPQLTIKSSEWVKKWDQHKNIQPELNKIENILTKRISNLNMDVLAVVDLTLSSERIQMQKEWIKKLRSIISEQNLYIAFIQGDTTTESLLATDYVLDNYFKPKHSGNKLLYRTILSKPEEMSGQQQTYFPKERQNTDGLRWHTG